MASSVLNIELSSMILTHNGTSSAEVDGILMLSWIYPRPNKPVITTARPIENIKNDHSIDFSSMPLGERFIFKEEAAGNSALVAEIAVTQSPALIAKIFDAILTKGIAQVTNPYLGSALGVILDSVGLKKERARVIGRAYFELDENSGNTQIAQDLIIPKPLNIVANSKREEDLEVDDTGATQFEENSLDVLGPNGNIKIDIS